MPYINYENKEIVFKLVYCGPGMSGKTTNLRVVHRNIAASHRGDLVVLDTTEERTLFFDFFPLDLGRIMGYVLRFNLYTVPGQEHYEASRGLIMDGADGVVFVADSQRARMRDNLASFQAMRGNLVAHGADPATFPLVLQYNKRDCEEPLALGCLESELALGQLPVLPAVAVRGEGVMETVREISRLVIQRFQP
jgi:signal recognition particle receptor subunit beta